MFETPRGLRLHIAILGRRNAGKSTLVNALSGQDVALVSPNPGTTTDPVEKTMEMGALGPVVLIDTAGVDDVGELGQKRVSRTLRILKRTDCALVVTESADWGEAEQELSRQLQERGLPFLVVRNFRHGVARPEADSWRSACGLDAGVQVLDVDAASGEGIQELLETLEEHGAQPKEIPLLADLVPDHGVVVFVVPLDTGAPKGRLILPQVQSIRDCLDGRKISVVCTEKDLAVTLASLKNPPSLVVCDSQVVHEVAAKTPEDVPLTTFSILMARFKGDLVSLARGARALAHLKPGQSILVQEACSHHPQADDIGRVKIPRLVQKLAGGSLNIEFAAGKEFGDYPQNCAVVIHCGGCTITRTQMLARQKEAGSMGFPMTNYGMAISLTQGVLPRVLKPFPEALAAFTGATD